MRNWFSRHPIWLMAFYLVFYLSVFHWLEVNITVPEVWGHCHLDDLIPFCKYAVIPYLAWFIWIPFTLFYLLWKAPRADFWRLCLPLFAGMTIALAVYVILPNGWTSAPTASTVRTSSPGSSVSSTPPTLPPMSARPSMSSTRSL